MRIARGKYVQPPGSIDERLFLVAGEGSGYIDIRMAAEQHLTATRTSTTAASAIAAVLFPGSLTRMLNNGPMALDILHQIAATPSPTLVPPDALQLVCPVDPPTYRDFMSFDEHIENTYASRGRTPPEILRRMPVYYKGATATFVGPGATVDCPGYADDLDYEMEFALVIGRRCLDVDPADALSEVFGIAVLNDFSARGMQFREMGGRLGPAKGKDFATSCGPYVVTLDELDVNDMTMIVRVNGQQISLGRSRSALWSAADLVSWASTGEPLEPGDVLGSGCVGGGSGLEQGIVLKPGDVVELEIGGVGILANTIGSRVVSEGDADRLARYGGSRRAR